MAVTVPCKAEDVYQLLSHQTACRNHRTPSKHSAAEDSQWLRLCVSVKPTAVFEMHHSHTRPLVQSRAKDDSLDHEFSLQLSRTVFFALLLAHMVTWKIYSTLSYLHQRHCFGLELWGCALTSHPCVPVLQAHYTSAWCCLWLVSAGFSQRQLTDVSQLKLKFWVP